MAILKDIEKEIKHAKDWVAAEYKYMRDVDKHIHNLEAEDIQAKEKDVKEAIRAFRYVGRSEYKANRIEEKLQKGLNELTKMLPAKEQEDLNRIRNAMNIFIANLQKHLSLYTGDLKDKLNNLAAEIKIAETRDVPTLRGEIQGMKATVHNLVTWLDGLQIELLNLDKFISKLKAAV